MLHIVNKSHTQTNALQSCLNSFAVYNPMRQVCAFIWTLQVESAWFQFLSCSSFPVK